MGAPDIVKSLCGARILSYNNSVSVMCGWLSILDGEEASMSEYLFTSESVSEGHPDKVADQISDAVLDAILAQDKKARVACETMVKTGVAIVAGEITTSAWVDLEALTRKVICDIGYTRSEEHTSELQSLMRISYAVFC